jgi:hypothetical protein
LAIPATISGSGWRKLLMWQPVNCDTIRERKRAVRPVFVGHQVMSALDGKRSFVRRSGRYGALKAVDETVGSSHALAMKKKLVAERLPITFRFAESGCPRISKLTKP